MEAYRLFPEGGSEQLPLEDGDLNFCHPLSYDKVRLWAMKSKQIVILFSIVFSVNMFFSAEPLQMFCKLCTIESYPQSFLWLFNSENN